MTDTIRIKRRAVGGAVGPPATLAAAEVAFNEQDNTLYYGGGNSAGAATSIFSIGGPGAFARLASPTFTGTVTISGTITGAGMSVYALLAGPTFTGVPAAPTATSGTNTTQLATTQFVTTAVGAVSASAVVTIADVAPSIVHGRLWFDSIASRLYIGYNDGNTTQWVAVA